MGIAESLWKEHGCRAKTPIFHNEELTAAARQADASEKELKEMLNPRQLVALDKCLNDYDQLNDLHENMNYYYGFKMGVDMVLDALLNQQ